MSDVFTVQSHAGPYRVTFDDAALSRLKPGFAILDACVADLYASELSAALLGPHILIEATETSKTLDKVSGYVERLLDLGFTRGCCLSAVGGGVIQDITCFIAGTMLRGVPWEFYPTTLLAQADSCIGSKSSINVGRHKNIVGTFTPPQAVWIAPSVLGSLSNRDLRSGAGEILKACAVAGPATFDHAAAEYPRWLRDQFLQLTYINCALKIKASLVEQDEFDRGARQALNYGHTFGHAIESATGFAVPHGIAVTIGMDMANYVSERLGIGTMAGYRQAHDVLTQNAAGVTLDGLTVEALLVAMVSDKKRTATGHTLLLPDAHRRIKRYDAIGTRTLYDACESYLSEERETCAA